MLDQALGHYADIIARDVGREVREAPGAGAAGGLGAAMLAFCGATIRSGAGLVLEMFSVEELLEAADVVFTGEGTLDAQIEFGKAVGVIALRARQYGVPVIAFAGNVQAGPARLAECGITSGVPIVLRPVGEEQAMAHAGNCCRRRWRGRCGCCSWGERWAASGATSAPDTGHGRARRVGNPHPRPLSQRERGRG